MREKIWLWWESTKHNMLFNYSFKYRQALRVIDIQEVKMTDQRRLLVTAKKAINKLQSELNIRTVELNQLKEISPFKGPQQFLADAIKEGETNE